MRGRVLTEIGQPFWTRLPTHRTFDLVRLPAAGTIFTTCDDIVSPQRSFGTGQPFLRRVGILK